MHSKAATKARTTKSTTKNTKAATIEIPVTPELIEAARAEKARRTAERAKVNGVLTVEQIEANVAAELARGSSDRLIIDVLGNATRRIDQLYTWAHSLAATYEDGGAVEAEDIVAIAALTRGIECDIVEVTDAARARLAKAVST